MNAVSNLKIQLAIRTCLQTTWNRQREMGVIKFLKKKKERKSCFTNNQHKYFRLIMVGLDRCIYLRSHYKPHWKNIKGLKRNKPTRTKEREEMTTDKRCQQRLGKQMSDTWFSSMNKVETQDCGWRANFAKNSRKPQEFVGSRNLWGWGVVENGIWRIVWRTLQLGFPGHLPVLTEQGHCLSLALQKTGGLFVLKMYVDDSGVDAELSSKEISGGKLSKNFVWLNYVDLWS